MSRSGSPDPSAMAVDVPTREATAAGSASPSTSGVSSVPGSGASTPPVRREEERKRQLKTMKRRATGMLVAMTVLFLLITVFSDGAGVWGYLQAMAEGSVVGWRGGGLALQAILRHPPRIHSHTAGPMRGS